MYILVFVYGFHASGYITNPPLTATITTLTPPPTLNTIAGLGSLYYTPAMSRASSFSSAHSSFNSLSNHANPGRYVRVRVRVLFLCVYVCATHSH